MQKMKLVGLVAALSISSTACTKAQFQGFLSQLQTDLIDGVALSTLEQLVDRYFPALAGDAAAVDAVLQAGISLLQSLGVLPASSAPNVNAIQLQIRAKITQNDPLSIKAQNVIAEIRGERPASRETAAFIRDLKAAF